MPLASISIVLCICSQLYDNGKKLRTVINQVKVFESGAECESYIRELEDDNILLIISEHLASTVVPHIHWLKKITLIYVYCLDCSKELEWTLKFSKIRAIFSDFNQLVKLLETNLKRKTKICAKPLPISIFNTKLFEERSSTNIDGGFLHFQLLIENLLRHDYIRTSHHEFFNLCKTKYANNHALLSILEKLEESYVPEKALYYYTRYSFFYGILNKALRIQDIRVMSSLQFFIRDLYQQLILLQRQQNQIPTRVYRGQLMSKQELKILQQSEGQFISMNSFLSTSLDRQTSLSFVSSNYDDFHAVLFEIYIDPCLSYRVKPFANITSKSHFINEQEILFMIATVFRLIRIYHEDEIVIVQMELNENYNYEVKILFDFMQKESEEIDDNLSYGNILYNAGKYDEAEQHYIQMLIQITYDDPLFPHYLGALGRVKKANGELKISSKWLKKALKMFQRTEDFYGIANCLQDLAHIHQLKGEFDEAIHKYNQALNIFNELFGYQSKLVANCLYSLGATYFEQHKIALSIDYYITALKIQKTILPRAHTDTAYTLNNIGNVYSVRNKCDQAFQFFEQTLDIFKRSLPSEHPSIAKTSCNIGLTYFKKDDHQRSLTFLDRALHIYQNIFPADHPEISRCQKTIDFIEKSCLKNKINRL